MIQLNKMSKIFNQNIMNIMIYTAILHNLLLKSTQKTAPLITKNLLNKSNYNIHYLLRSLKKGYLTITSVNYQLKKHFLNLLSPIKTVHPIGKYQINLFFLRNAIFLFFYSFWDDQLIFGYISCNNLPQLESILIHMNQSKIEKLIKHNYIAFFFFFFSRPYFYFLFEFK